MYRKLLALSLCLLPLAVLAEAPPGHPKVDEADRALHAAPELPNQGVVLEVIDTDKYTYLQVEDAGVQQWIAAGKTAVAKGAVVRYSKGNLMTNFHSTSLNRTFEQILFVGTLQTVTEASHPSVAEAQQILHLDPAAKDLPNLGRVRSTVAANNYTYIEVEQEGVVRWLAAPTVALENGTLIRYENGAVMKDFHSKKLDRTFPEIWFLGGVLVVDK